MDENIRKVSNNQYGIVSSREGKLEGLNLLLDVVIHNYQTDTCFSGTNTECKTVLYAFII